MSRHTTCTTVAGVWDGVPGFDIGLGVIAGVALIVASITIGLGIYSAAGITPQSMIIASVLLMVACLAAIKVVSDVRDLFFDHKLICLGVDQCAIAHVITIEDNRDGDQSLNTVLAPATSKTLEPEYAQMFQPAMLVYNDPGVSARGYKFVPKANRNGASPQTFGDGNLPFFHCEIEGRRFDDLTMAVLAYLWTLFAIALAALILANIFTDLGPIGWIVWAAIAFLIILLFILSSLFGSSPDTGFASAPDLGDATPGPNGPVITDSGGGYVQKNDFVALIGRPVCDTGHHGDTGGGCWNELHSVKGITRIQEAEYEKVTDPHTPNDIYDKYCAALHDYINGVAILGTALTSDNGGSDGQSIPYLEHNTIG